MSACTDGKKEVSAEDLYEKAAVSVVEVKGQYEGGTSTGSGFFYNERGTVVTNYHVIEKCTSADIVLNTGESYSVKSVLGYSKEKDIAILETGCAVSKALKVSSKTVATGETVYAIGTSLGFLSGSMSDGIVSAAERIFDGMMFIQITTPVSPGNSGGPLLDSRGEVIGIVSAGFESGQNLNLAIPIKEVLTIDISKPVTLQDLADSVGSSDNKKVEWIRSWRTQYITDESQHVLLFELATADEVAVAAEGTVAIKVVNENGETVFDSIFNFTPKDFDTWVTNDGTEFYYAAIYINDSLFDKGTSGDGTVYFTVYGDEYEFEECEIGIYNLPVLDVQLKLPELPAIISYKDYWGDVQSKVKITGVTYEIMYGDTLAICFSGEKVFDKNGKSNNDSCWFAWKLYDSQGCLIDNGTVLTKSLQTGDKFKDEMAYVFNGIVMGEVYKLVVLEY